MTHEVEIVVENDCCKPDCPAPDPGTQQTPEYCEGTITGTVKMECCCCCPKLYTRTFIVSIGPQSEPNLINFMQTTVNAYESGGYRVLAHSLVDTGAGWLLGLTIGWYM